MKRTFIMIVSTLALLAATALPSDAARKHPKAPATTLRVHVIDLAGRSVWGARVVIHRHGARGSAIVHTNRAGNVDVRPNPGVFSVSVTHHGFVRGGAATSVRKGEAGRVEVRLLGRHALIVHAHQAHRLGLVHHDEHHESRRHIDAKSGHEALPARGNEAAPLHPVKP